jgi:hypothetical protein
MSRRRSSTLESDSSRRFERMREDFDCSHCGEHVIGNGFTNHCPRCLWSRHVDENPGDRAATCGGAMKPIAVTSSHGNLVVVQECVVCGHRWRNRSAPDDDPGVLIRLSATPLVELDRNRPPRARKPKKLPTR